MTRHWIAVPAIVIAAAAWRWLRSRRRPRVALTMDRPGGVLSGATVHPGYLIAVKAANVTIEDCTLLDGKR